MKYFHACAVVVFLSPAFTGCKSSGDSSSTKTNFEAANVLDYGFSSLDPGAVAAICNTNTLIVYVGNAESMGEFEYSPTLGDEGVKHKKTINEGMTQFHKTVLDSAADLQGALAKTKCHKSSESKVDLLSIIDGPKMNDSVIEVFQYGFNSDKWIKIKSSKNSKSSSDKYSYKDEKLTYLTKPTDFELNMPKSLGKIVTQVDKLYGSHDQILYLIKSHGGMVSTLKQSAPDLNAVVKLGDKYSENRKHVFLYDSHDEKGPVKSGIYTYFWTKNRACTLFKAEGLKDAALNAECDGKKVVKKTQGTDGSATQGTEGSATQGTEGSATQGTEGSATQGTDGSATQGFADGTATQGPGKGLMYLRYYDEDQKVDLVPFPELSKKDADKKRPDIILHIGAAASYDFSTSEIKNKNIYALSLPLGKKPAKKPTLMVLDSCYGSDQIANSAEFVKSSAASLNSKSRKDTVVVCTLSNPLPTYTHTVNYSLLDSSDFLAMSQLFYWEKFPSEMPDSAEQISEMTIKLHNAFLNPGQKTEVSIKRKYQAGKIAIDDLKKEYLSMKPVCLELKPETPEKKQGK